MPTRIWRGHFVLVPERRAGVVVLTNMDGVDASSLATELMKIILGIPAK